MRSNTHEPENCIIFIKHITSEFVHVAFDLDSVFYENVGVSNSVPHERFNKLPVTLSRVS